MRKYLLSITLAVTVSVWSASFAYAIDRNAQSNRLYQCQQRAQQISGYYGNVPDRHLRGGALIGAAGGAFGVGLIARIAGGNRSQVRNARRTGAILGAIGGAIKRGVAKDRQRKQRQRYQYEIQVCMSSRY